MKNIKEHFSKKDDAKDDYVEYNKFYKKYGFKRINLEKEILECLRFYYSGYKNFTIDDIIDLFMKINIEKVVKDIDKMIDNIAYNNKDYGLSHRYCEIIIAVLTKRIERKDYRGEREFIKFYALQTIGIVDKDKSFQEFYRELCIKYFDNKRYFGGIIGGLKGGGKSF